MARLLGALLATAMALTVVSAVEKFTVPHSVILEKFHPIVKEFSSALTNKVDQGNKRLQAAVFDKITQTLAVQMDDFIAKTNNSAWYTCCWCRYCHHLCSACGKVCCCKGDGGCTCRSCASDPLKMDLVSVDFGTQATNLQTWFASLKETLIFELRPTLAANSAPVNTKCCACTKCRQWTIGMCGLPACCTSGDICVCKQCAASGLIQMDKVENFVSLTPEAEAAVQEVNGLVDQLMTVMTVQ